MAIPFYENEEQIQQQTQNPEQQEIDQVDGPAIGNNTLHNSPYLNATDLQQNQELVTEEDLLAWKILALAMCKALKDHYQQTINPTNENSSTTTSSNENPTAIIQILPNGQVQPKWN